MALLNVLGPIVVAMALAAASAPAHNATERGPRFVDVAPRSRLSYVSNNNYTGRKYFP